MLRSRFGLQNQDFGASVGAIDLVFRDLSVPTGPGVPKIEFFFILVPDYFLTTFLHQQIARCQIVTPLECRFSGRLFVGLGANGA